MKVMKGKKWETRENESMELLNGFDSALPISAGTDICRWYANDMQMNGANEAKAYCIASLLNHR